MPVLAGEGLIPFSPASLAWRGEGLEGCYTRVRRGAAEPRKIRRVDME